MSICSICGREIKGYGNNPYPIRTDENALCCNECNDRYVIAARLALLTATATEKEEVTKMLNKQNVGELEKIFYE